MDALHDSADFLPFAFPQLLFFVSEVFSFSFVFLLSNGTRSLLNYLAATNLMIYGGGNV